jgi:transposase
MEISSSAHHWARRLLAMGLQPRLMSAQLVKPYRSEGATGKNDANDAAAICEAASRPTMRFVPVKSIEQQSMLCVHRLRDEVDPLSRTPYRDQRRSPKCL